MILLGLGARPAAAHGINGHVHVTGWAIESLPEGSVLAQFFLDRLRFEAALIGGAFPDSGYAIDDPYGELAHWEPFIEGWVEHVKRRYGPDYADPEAQRQLAFLMGAAAHGLQDEIFDSLFLLQVAEHDNATQDETDPGTDAFLHTDGHARFQPAVWLPGEDLVQVFSEAHGHTVTEAKMRAGLNRVKSAVIDLMPLLAPGLDARYRPLMPWGSLHYLDPAVPGSLASEVPATAAYMQALWQRLHDGPPVAVTHGWPEPTRRLRANRPGAVDAWITVVFGIGARVGSLTAENVVLRAPDGEPAPYRLHHSRWTGRADDATRLLRIEPTVDLLPDATYTLEVGPGVELQDGTLSEDIWVFQIRTACVDDGAPGCEVAEEAPFPPPPPPDAGLEADGGLGDAGVTDFGSDAGAYDAGPDDAGPEDAESEDGQRVEVSLADAMAADADSELDLAPGASGDAGTSGTGGPAATGGGGGCAQSVVRQSETWWSWASLGLLGWLGQRRRRHVRQDQRVAGRFPRNR